MIRLMFDIRDSQEIDRRHVAPISGNRSDARGSDLRSHQGLW